MKSLLLFALSMFGIVSLQSSSPVLPTPVQNPVLTGQKAIDHLKSTGQYDSLGAAITGARYGVSAGPAHKQMATAANPAQGIFSTFTPEGLRMQIRSANHTNANALSCDWKLESLGYGAAQVAVPAGELKVAGQRAEIIRVGSGQSNLRFALRIPQLIEWFQNTPGGLEHGFSLAERPLVN